jgi:hypothetical protein
MPLLQVKKVVAVCFLEAAKLTLEHIGAHRLDLSQQGITGPDQLPRLYGDVRRLRDYLQRCVSGYQDLVSLDLSDSDQTLLVACCRRSVEAIEKRLSDEAVVADEQQWLIKKRQVLADWAFELAQKPIVELPLKRIMPMASAAIRSLNSRIQEKVYGEVRLRAKYTQPQSSAGQPPSSMPTFGLHQPNDWPLDHPEKPTSPIAGSPPGIPESARPVLAPLLDSNKMRDPRLRALMGVDLQALGRAYGEADYRLATVLLASIMEGAALDCAIPRRSELGLIGTPDTWDLQRLLLNAMGSAVESKDSALAFHLFASRNLLRPALQMMTPAVVTCASFERLHAFVVRALHALGFGAPSTMQSPSSLSLDDLK